MTSIAPLARGAATGETSSPDILASEAALRSLLRALGSVVVAYSGGVDSSYVAHIAIEELGARALAVTGESPSLAKVERDAAADLAARFEFNHEFIDTEEFGNPRYRENNVERCFFCKDELYGKLAALAQERGFSCVVDGSTMDDLGDHRPGRRAAAALGVRSPLIEVGMTKNTVRELSLRAGLPTWDKPASPCLSSRIAHGTPVTIKRLRTVEEGESILREMGFREFRVRHHDELVRIEIAPTELDRALSRSMADSLAARFRILGFRYVTLDLHGYRQGAMNEILKQ